ncbi:hypothetical protein [Hahella sp. HN01]|uniref:hypothetical protein n=1 Tax=Hahella sp. HN01 TaxID=2847262 RepID=UPI001C1EE201|nr:hypothetical protein [Hahella sp. HN01]MBU6953557.1 hypothetical protein [Hahella sp. HN01]
MSKIIQRAILVQCIIFSPLAAAYEVSDLVGTWQSNEEMTLRSMEAAPGIPEKTRAFFRSGFFGKLIVVSRENESIAYFVDEKPENLEFIPHVIHKVSDKQFSMEYPGEGAPEHSIRIITLDGDCYSIKDGKWEFYEYFCRVE